MEKPAFTAEQVKEFQECFDTFDQDNNKSISRRELHALLHTVGHKVDAKGLENLLIQYDSDESGTIDFPEFLLLVERLLKHKASNFSEDELESFRESFNAFDKNGDGSINKSELRSLLRIVGEKYHAAAIANSMDQFDSNKDNTIDFDEFLILANKLIKNTTTA
ncbi:hypothetical protein BGZ70_001462 [Mortierella alpina]|uniref:EF-hand domain-containing protein n=1 Tax=Mortierella alpina TaxID=64518 RepID=A0A9P6IVX0_MORAP|nr:hypothetical protein BGZ70_001462 [Mortierella alpina]